MPTQFFWETEPKALSMLRVSSTTEPWEATAKGFQQLIVVGYHLNRLEPRLQFAITTEPGLGLCPPSPHPKVI